MTAVRAKREIEESASPGLFSRVNPARPPAALAVVVVVAVGVFTWLTPLFFTVANAQTILRSVAFIGIITMGMTVLLITGEFDLSVGSVAALGAVVAGQLAVAGIPVIVAILAGVLGGALVGLLNAWLTLWIRIPVFVVTLGTLYMARGAALVITDGQPINDVPNSLIAFSRAAPLGLPWAVWLMFALGVAAQLVLSFTETGRMLYAAGGNPEAARLAGVPVRRLRTVAFVLVAALSALTGILIMARLQVGQPSIGTGYELSVIAAAVVGGVSLFGGVGSALGALLGVLFVQVIATGLVLTQFDPSLQPVGIGVAMLVAIGLDARRRLPNRRGQAQTKSPPAFKTNQSPPPTQGEAHEVDQLAPLTGSPHHTRAAAGGVRRRCLGGR